MGNAERLDLYGYRRTLRLWQEGTHARFGTRFRLECSMRSHMQRVTPDGKKPSGEGIDFHHFANRTCQTSAKKTRVKCASSALQWEARRLPQDALPHDIVQ